MFIKFYNSNTPSNRNKKSISSILSSNNFFKQTIVKLQYFKKKIKNNHKNLSNTNCIYKVNNSKILLGSFLLLNYIKVSYSNSFFGFVKTSDNCIFLKKLCYGFSFLKRYEINAFDDTINEFLHNENYPFFDRNMKFFHLFNLECSFKVYLLNIYKKKYKIAVSAGTFCNILNRDLNTNLCTIKIPSGKILFLDLMSTVYVGRNANIFSKFMVLSKYSNTLKYKNRRPSVRGIAKNPIDHPNGGRSKVKKPFKNP